ncbi:MAG: hypothetical protein K2K64_08110 [Muribaculaceae bacterium]|nr:hypothetical protein [Muribaculaceae bacterium]
METNEIKDYYRPQEPVHPFDILEDELEAREISKKDFAIRIGMQPSNFSRMLKNRGDLSSELALKLEMQLGIPYLHWMKFQEDYLRDKLGLQPFQHTNDAARSNHAIDAIHFQV